MPARRTKVEGVLTKAPLNPAEAPAGKIDIKAAYDSVKRRWPKIIAKLGS